MINKLKKIEILTKIFVKDFYQRTKLINKENNNINKKSVWFWIIILLGIAMTYISYKSISWLKSNGMPELFLTLYMMFTLFLLVLQTIAASSSVYFFSKDLEFILPLPVRPIELLVSKYNTLLIMLYSTEFVFSVLPFFLYGFMNYTGFKYFLLIAIILILIPIIIVSAISLITIILMKIFSFIKNRNIIQNIISFLLTMILCLIEFIMLGNTESLNKNFINTYIVETLYTSDLNLIWKNIGILIIVSIVTFIVFIIFGKNNYLKSILKSIVGKKVFFINKKAIKIKLKKTNIENLFHAIRLFFLFTAQRNGLFAIHSASVLYQGKAWLFSGHSGMGKSTHTALWHELFDTPYLNGDLNLLGLKEDHIIVYGIPWCGTSGIFTAETYELGGIVLLGRDLQTDYLEELNPSEKVLRVMQRMISPAWTERQLSENLFFAGEIADRVPVLHLLCTKNASAACVMKNAIDQLEELQ